MRKLLIVLPIIAAVSACTAAQRAVFTTDLAKAQAEINAAKGKVCAINGKYAPVVETVASYIVDAVNVLDPADAQLATGLGAAAAAEDAKLTAACAGAGGTPAVVAVPAS